MVYATLILHPMSVMACQLQRCPGEARNGHVIDTLLTAYPCLSRGAIHKDIHRQCLRNDRALIAATVGVPFLDQ